MHGTLAEELHFIWLAWRCAARMQNRIVCTGTARRSNETCRVLEHERTCKVKGDFCPVCTCLLLLPSIFLSHTT